MAITTPDNRIVHALKDDNTNLYFLPPMQQVAMLAKTYKECGDGKQSKNQLWNLHLKYGHRSFPDLSKAYKIAMPKGLACTSCIMGKSHIQPHYTGDTPRASRRAEGFHSDFRGPFSTPAPNGELYLLTITDDYSKRIFPYLVKSQTEWFEIWRNFVARVEADLGMPTVYLGYSLTMAWSTNHKR